jgi:hypothetical protein
MGPDLNPRIEAAPMVAVLLALLPMAVAAHPPPNEIQIYDLFSNPLDRAKVTDSTRRIRRGVS